MTAKIILRNSRGTDHISGEHFTTKRCMQHADQEISVALHDNWLVREFTPQKSPLRPVSYRNTANTTLSRRCPARNRRSRANNEWQNVASSCAHASHCERVDAVAPPTLRDLRQVTRFLAAIGQPQPASLISMVSCTHAQPRQQCRTVGWCLNPLVLAVG